MFRLLQFLIVIGHIDSVLSMCSHSYSVLQKLSLLNKDKTDFNIYICLFNRFKSVKRASVTTIELLNLVLYIFLHFNRPTEENFFVKGSYSLL